MALEGIERLEQRAGGRLGPDHEPRAVAVVEDPHAVALRGLPGGLDRARREEVDVDVDDHGLTPGAWSCQLLVVAASACAAARAAATMFLYPVQRHRLPEMASRICASDGSGHSRRKQVSVIRKPGVQKPHWSPWCSWNACCKGFSVSPSARPSTVSTWRPLTCAAKSRHERTA